MGKNRGKKKQTSFPRNLPRCESNYFYKPKRLFSTINLSYFFTPLKFTYYYLRCICDSKFFDTAKLLHCNTPGKRYGKNID